MTGATPRLRMFAGPNGSGKSVLKSRLPEELLGTYLNPDEIEADAKAKGYAEIEGLGIFTTPAEILSAFSGSDFLRNQGLLSSAGKLDFTDGRLIFPAGVMNSYFASVLADFLRRKLLQANRTFTFETVMSHPGKVQLLREALNAGYRTYLYYVATDDPAINVSRVANRVALGGHSVPEGKIIERYHKSLALLLPAIRNSSRAYIFDNSTSNTNASHTWLAEVTDGRTLELKADQIPAWFKHAVLDKIT